MVLLAAIVPQRRSPVEYPRNGERRIFRWPAGSIEGAGLGMADARVASFHKSAVFPSGHVERSIAQSRHLAANLTWRPFAARSLDSGLRSR
jgi:hypothetical protein